MQNPCHRACDSAAAERANPVARRLQQLRTLCVGKRRFTDGPNDT